MTATHAIRLLTSAQRGILEQKRLFMRLLCDEMGREVALNVYSQSPKYVSGSIGQHMRHSMDHLEKSMQSGLIEYDKRERETESETCWTAMEDRLSVFEAGLSSVSDLDEVVRAQFLMGQGESFYDFESNRAREMGFAVHHAIHHLAMIRVIGRELQLNDDLLVHVGVAPSTIDYGYRHT